MNLSLRTPEPLRTVVVEVANVCNFECPQCAYHHPDSGMEFLEVGRFDTIALGSSLAGAERIRFLGLCEPTLHPELDQMLAICHQRGLKSHVISNGSFVFRESARRRLLVGASELEVSIDAADPETYSLVRGKSPKYFLRLVEALRRFFRENHGRFGSISVSFVQHGVPSDEEFRRFSQEWEPYVDTVRLRTGHSFNGRSRLALARTLSASSRAGSDRLACGFHHDRLFVDRGGFANICNLDAQCGLGPIFEPHDISRVWEGQLRMSMLASNLEGRCSDCEQCSGLG